MIDRSVFNKTGSGIAGFCQRRRQTLASREGAKESFWGHGERRTRDDKGVEGRDAEGVEFEAPKAPTIETPKASRG